MSLIRSSYLRLSPDFVTVITLRLWIKLGGVAYSSCYLFTFHSSIQFFNCNIYCRLRQPIQAFSSVAYSIAYCITYCDPQISADPFIVAAII